MQSQDFTTAISIDRSRDEAFAAINRVSEWWSGSIEGDTDKPGAEFTYRYKDAHYSKQKITDLIQGERIVWRVLDSNLKFVTDKSEWTDTDIIFDIAEIAGKTEIRFTHAGLAPHHQCYGSCSNAWTILIQRNLRQLILTGESQPDPFL